MRRWYPVLHIAFFCLAFLAVTTPTLAQTDAAASQQPDTTAGVLDSQAVGDGLRLVGCYFHRNCSDP